MLLCYLPNPQYFGCSRGSKVTGGVDIRRIKNMRQEAFRPSRRYLKPVKYLFRLQRWPAQV